MALTIATAGSGVAPAAEQPAAESPSSQTSDAFAGVLAGVGESGARPGRQDPAEDRTGARGQQADRAGTDTEVDAQAAADLAVLALLAPALPPSTVALFNSGYSAAATTATDEAGKGGSPPVDAPAAGTLPGPAVQAAEPAHQAAARRPVQAVAAQAAAFAAKAARQDELPDVAAGQLPGPVASHPSERPDAVGATGHGQQAPTAIQTAHAARPPAGIEATPAAGAAGSGPLELTGTASLLAGMTTTVGAVGQTTGGAASSALTQAFAVIQTTDSATPAVGQPLPAKQPGPASAALSAAGTLPGTAAVVAGTAGAVRASAGVHHRSARGGAGAPAEPLPPVTMTAVASAPAVATTIPDPASSTAPAAGSAMQPAPAGVIAGQPVSAGRNSPPVHQHPAADQPVASQVAGPVLALRARGDGSHQLIVALHPAELGPINVHVRIVGDAMTISLASTSETAHETLRDALPQLRAELQSAGLNSASLSLDLTSGDPNAFADPRYADPAQADSRQSGGQHRAATAPATDQPFSPVRPRVSGARIGVPSSSGLDRWL